MTQWFDTNCHYIVLEFDADTPFRIGSSQLFREEVVTALDRMVEAGRLLRVRLDISQTETLPA